MFFFFFFVFFVFFFQAEDGIRDAQESRGLGDVYKRQERKDAKGQVVKHTVSVKTQQPLQSPTQMAMNPIAVSYTHLTLPTIYSV